MANESLISWAVMTALPIAGGVWALIRPRGKHEQSVNVNAFLGTTQVIKKELRTGKGTYLGNYNSRRNRRG